MRTIKRRKKEERKKKVRRKKEERKKKDMMVISLALLETARGWSCSRQRGSETSSDRHLKHSYYR
jgi:hypothetical protein